MLPSPSWNRYQKKKFKKKIDIVLIATVLLVLLISNSSRMRLVHLHGLHKSIWFDIKHQFMGGQSFNPDLNGGRKNGYDLSFPEFLSCERSLRIRKCLPEINWDK